MKYYTSETVTMVADEETCKALQKVLEPEFTEHTKCKIENGEFFCSIYGDHVNINEILIEFTKEHKNILVEHNIHDWEIEAEFPDIKYFYKNGKFTYTYIEFGCPVFDVIKELPDID